MRVYVRLLVAAIVVFCPSLFAQTWKESTVYTFVSGDGGPAFGVNLIQADDGNFYGTTQSGGSGSNGTVFRLTPGGSYDIIYSFCTSGGSTCSDGANPEGALVQGSDGNLYGTARAGGASQDGTAFRMSLSGSFTLLHAFCSEGGTDCTDGKFPTAAMVQGSDGNFYGTTAGGNGGGTVFKLTSSGTLTTLYQFTSATGYGPALGVVEYSSGNFFGASDGHFFTITSAGTFTDIAYATCEPNCPNDVESTPVEGADGEFYLTSDSGGTEDDGEVFKVAAATGDITDLHSMCTVASDGDNCTDGENPQASLVEGSDGNFYGTASSGGAPGHNQGTVFQVTPGGTYTALYDFCPTAFPAAAPTLTRDWCRVPTAASMDLPTRSSIR